MAKIKTERAAFQSSSHSLFWSTMAKKKVKFRVNSNIINNFVLACKSNKMKLNEIKSNYDAK